MDHNEQLSCHEDKLSELEKRIIRVEDALSILAPRPLAPNHQRRNHQRYRISCLAIRGTKLKEEYHDHLCTPSGPALPNSRSSETRQARAALHVPRLVQTQGGRGSERARHAGSLHPGAEGTLRGHDGEQMNRPYCNPTWTRQHSLAEFALRQCLPLTARNMDAYCG